MFSEVGGAAEGEGGGNGGGGRRGAADRVLDPATATGRRMHVVGL